MSWLDKIPYSVLIVISLTLGLAPFFPEPHLWEKLKMLFQGTLVRPIDIFDFLMHGAAPMLLVMKLIRAAVTGSFGGAQP